MERKRKIVEMMRRENSGTSDEEEIDHKKGRARQPRELSIDCFTGRSTETSVGTFLAQFKIVATQNGWPKSQGIKRRGKSSHTARGGQ